MSLALYMDHHEVVHVEQDRASISALREDITLIAETHTSEEMRNRMVYVPL